MVEFAGMTEHVLQQRDFRVVLTECAPDVRLPRHQHRHAFLSFLFAGDYAEGSVGRMRDCRPGDVTWHPAGDCHEVLHGPATVRSLQVEFIGESFEKMDFSGLPRRRSTARVAEARLPAMDIRREVAHPDRFSNLAIRGSILSLLACLGREFQSGGEERLIAAISDAIRASFPDLPDIEALASELGLAPARLLAAYRRRSGEGLRATVQRLRLEHAIHLLRDSDLPLAQIAIECGYYDQSHFSHAFARAMAHTPSAWRRSVSGRMTTGAA
jgi:AraC family transcriptional regulator